MKKAINRYLEEKDKINKILDGEVFAYTGEALNIIGIIPHPKHYSKIRDKLDKALDCRVSRNTLHNLKHNIIYIYLDMDKTTDYSE